MYTLIDITDFSAPELDVYARLTENQLVNRADPANALFICESPVVIERALDSGCVPVSMLIERKHVEGKGKAILCGAVLATVGGLLGMTWGAALAGERPSPQPVGIRVENVLVNPSTTTYDRVDDGHPEAIECDLTLHFPRDFDEDLRGARVTVRGTEYEVIGSPQRYTDANLPPGCPWNLTAKVVRFDG